MRCGFIFAFGSFLEYIVDVSTSRLLWRYVPGAAVSSLLRSGKSSSERFVSELRSSVGIYKMGGVPEPWQVSEEETRESRLQALRWLSKV